jgi:hypothetical protein
MRNWFTFEHYRWVVLAGVVSLILWGHGTLHGGLGWSDAPLHAMDGVFVHDLVKAKLFVSGTKQTNQNKIAAPPSEARNDNHKDSISEWATNYYVRYPCLGLIVFYPPMHAIVEAMFYSLFGVSVITAKCSVFFFGLMGFFSMVWLGRQLFNPTAGFFAGAIWATLPSTVLWSQDVMLEIPTTAMLILTCALYVRFKNTNSFRWWVLTCVSFVLSVLTKQWAIFFGAVLAIDQYRSGGFKKSKLSATLAGLGSSFLVIILYLTFSGRYAALSRFLVTGDPPWRHLLTSSTWLFYLKAMPDVLGWPMIGFTGIGFLLTAVNRQMKKIRIPIVWFIAFYFFATIIAYKEPRYLYPIVPAGVLLASAGLSEGLVRTRVGWLGRFLLFGVLVVQAVHGLMKSPQQFNDYSQAARLVSGYSSSPLVLVDAVRDGQFIFDMRRINGADGKFYILRGSKLLYSRAARTRWLYEQYVRNEDEILQMIQSIGIRTIVVESSPPNIPDWQDYFPLPCQWLRQLLKQNPDFEKIASYPVGDDDVWKGVTLDVYRYNGKITPQTDTLIIPIPSMGRNVKIKLPSTQTK